MGSRRLSIGIVGAGKISVDFHIPVLRAMDQAQIAWVADVNAERVEAVARTHGLKAVRTNGIKPDLPKCDVVLLATPLPPRAHYFAALEHGDVAVFAEKPLANNAEEHRSVVSAFEPWRLSVGYQRRQHALSRLLRRLAVEQPLGALKSIRIAEGSRVTRAGDFYLYQDESVDKGGGITKNLGCHSLDLALWIAGTKSFAVLDRRIEWDGGTDRRASARISLLALHGKTGHDCDLDWTVSWLDRQPNTIELEFEHGRVRGPLQPGACLDFLSRTGDYLGRLDAQETGGACTNNQAYCLEWRAVLNGTATRTENEMSGRSAIPTAELIDELLRR